MDLTAMGAF